MRAPSSEEVRCVNSVLMKRRLVRVAPDSCAMFVSFCVFLFDKGFCVYIDPSLK